LGTPLNFCCINAEVAILSVVVGYPGQAWPELLGKALNVWFVHDFLDRFYFY
jgi:hypothetical protein